MTVFGLMEYANPKRGPTFQLDFPYALLALKTVAPFTPTGFGALGSNVEKRLYSSLRPPCQSKRNPKVTFRFFMSLRSSLPQKEAYFIFGMYLNGTEKLALST